MNDMESMNDLDTHQYCTLEYRIHVKISRETGKVVYAIPADVSLRNNPAMNIHEQAGNFVNSMLDYIRDHVIVPEELRAR